MTSIKINSVTINNFKGLSRLHIDFSKDTVIRGRNATGKSSVADSLSWLLFNKNTAGETDFAARPKDAEGNDIHNIEISVEAVIDVTDASGVTLTHTLKKVSREKWTKKRGSDVAELQGNETVYTIDEFPKKKTEYETFVAGLIPQNIFRMITDPYYFTSMKWTDQRKILMDMVTNESYTDIAMQLGGFEELLPDLQVASSLDDIVKKYKSQKRSLDDRVSEIPIRIDELTKMLTEVDVASLEKEKEAIDAKELEASIERDALKATINKTSDEIHETMQRMDEISNNMRLESINATSGLREEISQLQVDINTAVGEMDYAERSISHKKEEVAAIEKHGESLNAQYMDWMSKELSDEDTRCPVCGRTLPAERVSQLKEEFEKKKTDTLKGIKQDAKMQKKHKEDTLASIEECKARYQKYADMKKVCEERMAEAKEELANASITPAPQTNSEWVELNEKCERLKTELAEMQNKASQIPVNAHADELNRINTMLSKAKENDAIKNRIAELQAEQRSLAQKVMDTERMLDMAERFIKAQLDFVSGQVNDKFDNVQWRLFEQQYNGAIVPVCTAQVNGVDYADLNTGEKIAAGLRIIKTLQREYGYSAWIIIDNAEALDKEHRNSIKMPNQMIWLVVDDNEKLEVGER